MHKFINLILLGFCLQFNQTSNLFAQIDTKWDDTAKSEWDSALQKVEIRSSSDGKIQRAYMYSSKSKTKKPLIVCLHTWSGDYSQKDSRVNEILARDWNYIHPDFRGPNKTPQSTGSSLVISDIEDAIQYALKNTNSDPEDVHLLGASGGGFATLVAYMNIKYPVKSFSAWVPISNLEAWYWESLGRKHRYANDIFTAVSSDTTFNFEEARRRSPLFQKYPLELRKNAKLYIYDGIHDGYTGSVPITHSINMYNRLVGELKYGFSNLDRIMLKAQSDSSLISEKEIISLVTKRTNPFYNKQQKLFDRDIYLKHKFNNIQLTIFEGGHEEIPQALGLIPAKVITNLKYNILTIADENGQNKDGWVGQLKKMMPQSNIVNISRSSETIGFGNNEGQSTNALANIDNYLDDAQKTIKNRKYDFIIVCLGTNDAKSEYADRQDEIAANLNKLLKKITQHRLSKESLPKFIYVTPPPIQNETTVHSFEGGSDRIARLIPELTNVAKQAGFDVIDVYHPLVDIVDYYAEDGVHMAGPGQEIVATQIIEVIRKIE